MFEGTFYRRNLPHWHPPGVPLFITWRLHGSLPAGKFEKLKTKKMTAGQRYALLDRELDKAAHGPAWLKDPRIARCIVMSLQTGASELSLFNLHAFVVMPNHVHVLLTPLVPLARITRGMKRRSSAQANALLHRQGLPFWQDESFDHWIRNNAEAERVKHYIEWNPVKAGLALRPEDWPWSSASKKSLMETSG